VILAFLDSHAARIGLSEDERAAIGRAVTTPEGLHGLLLAGSLPLPAARQREIGQRIWPLLPARYRAFLSGDAPTEAMPRGAMAPAAPSPAPPPEDWPGRRGPASLAGEGAVSGLLEDALRRDWPPRDQGASPTCVAFAACAALEAAGAVAPGHRLSAAFLYQRMRERPSDAPGAAQGATKLGTAAAVLAEEGIVTERAWRDSASLVSPPPSEILAAARANRLAGIAYWDRADHGWPGAARAVLELLREGRPVAISLPEYQAPVGRGAITNWRMPSVWLQGEVLDPPEGWTRTLSGHAVCILGFQPAEEEALGGWFIFRNSLGLRFAENAPDPARRRADGSVPAPFVPDNGYGALSASHVDAHLWEIFAPAPAGFVAPP
jgi:hypothetical protein